MTGSPPHRCQALDTRYSNDLGQPIYWAFCDCGYRGTDRHTMEWAAFDVSEHLRSYSDTPPKPLDDDVRCQNCAALSAAPLCPGCRANIDYGLSC